MKIEEIAIQNFRSYREAQKIERLSSINTFVGPNGAGKSNVLETLKLLKRLNASNDLGIYTEMVYNRNPNSEIKISLRFLLSNSEREKIIGALFKQNRAINIENLKKLLFLRPYFIRLHLQKKG